MPNVEASARRGTKKLRAGVDLGGTKIESSVVDRANNVLGSSRHPTPLSGGPPAVAEAIITAIRLARPGDLVITCGKAHEQTMCYGTSETPWDEFAVIRAGLAARGL